MKCAHTFIWEYFNGMSVCECSSPINSRKELISLRKGYMKFCSKCRIINGRLIAQKAMIKNGTHQNSEHHKQKVAETKIKNWGSSGFVNLEKAKKTKLERYGNEYYSNQKKKHLQRCLKNMGFIDMRRLKSLDRTIQD